jgi:hypothetical protein
LTVVAITLASILTLVLEKVADHATKMIRKIGTKQIWLVEDTKEETTQHD